MSWSDAIPNLLIGLREGLEAALVVSILLAALHKTRAGAEPISSAPIWLGVVGAVSLAASFAAVLTYSTSVLSSGAQEALSGLLSVAAVALVTGMVFWMRRAAAGLSAQLRGEVERAVTFGAGALAITAFLAVGREGLETTLFLWTAAKASGQTVAPLVGAALGIGAAVALCWLLYHRAIRLDLGTFFSRTALVLIVIAAGILAYGLGDLQEAGLLPGLHWLAFDLTSHIDAGSWWASLISGTTELTPKMTVLQAVAWVVFLAVVIPAFVRAGRTVPERAPAAPSGGTERASVAHGDGWWSREPARHPWVTAGVLILAPAVAAMIAIGILPSAASATTRVTVTKRSCAPEWTAGHTGTQTVSVDNTSSRVAEVDLDDASGAVVAEVETLGPGTTATMAADLGPGTYHFQCNLNGQPPRSSAPVQISGAARGRATSAIAPVTAADLPIPNIYYQTWADAHLRTLSAQVSLLRAALVAGNLPAARADWLAAQMSWEEVGASYDSFGDLGLAVDGLPDGLPKGTADPGFTGLHRLEYGLWHGQPASVLVPVADTLQHDVQAVRDGLTDDALAGDPTNLPIRAHEILEDALRDHLSGLDDEGAGAAYPETYADLQATRAVLGYLAPLITARAPSLLAAAHQQMAVLETALSATRTDGRWRAPEAVPRAAREQVDSAIGSLLETLSAVPNLLEVHQRS